MSDNAKLMVTIESKPLLTILKNNNNDTEAEYNNLPKAGIGRDIQVPDSFDGREVWKGLLSPVKNQGSCGSCWAFASSSTLADRFNIQSKGQLHINLSPAKMILCDFQGKETDVLHPEIDPTVINKINKKALKTGACRGNTLADAWRYLYTVGTNTEECIPYDKSLGGEFKFDSLSQFSKNSKLPLCSDVSGILGDMCSDVAVNNFTGDQFGTPARFYRCLHYYTIDSNEEAIKYNIYNYGPVTTGMSIYSDFYYFDSKKSIYSWNGRGNQVGGHAIEIVGWGNEDGKKYWIIRNSWGPKWGRDGYFYISRGNNECQIEINCLAGIPDFFYPEGYIYPNLGDFLFGETNIAKQNRTDIDTKLNIFGGGIDPQSGYSRRILSTKPWINFHRPITLKHIPDPNSFIAGQFSIQKNKKKNIFSILLLFCIFIVSGIFIFLILKNRK
jgi:hypothetical protein